MVSSILKAWSSLRGLIRVGPVQNPGLSFQHRLIRLQNIRALIRRRDRMAVDGICGKVEECLEVRLCSTTDSYLCQWSPPKVAWLLAPTVAAKLSTCSTEPSVCC
ncbi:hypothetical protein PS2_001460 [Malus domestica]